MVAAALSGPDACGRDRSEGYSGQRGTSVPDACGRDRSEGNAQVYLIYPKISGILFKPVDNNLWRSRAFLPTNF